jgi:hypothetical protein
MNDAEKLEQSEVLKKRAGELFKVNINISFLFHIPSGN